MLQYVAGILVLTALVVFSGYKLITSVISDRRAEEEHQRLLNMVVAGQPQTSAEGSAETDESGEDVELLPAQYPPLSIDMEALREMNGDFRGWFYFPAVEVSYPVVQGEDNEYYLKHSFEKEKSNSGSIFMDCGASPDWSDRNTFVFGHNIRKIRYTPMKSFPIIWPGRTATGIWFFHRMRIMINIRYGRWKILTTYLMWIFREGPISCPCPPATVRQELPEGF